MTVETQVLRAVQGGGVFSVAGLTRVACCSEGRIRRAVAVLVALGLIGRGQFGRRRQVYFAK